MWGDSNENTQYPSRSRIPKTYPFLASWPGAMINPRWLELLLSRTNFHGPKGVRAIEVRLYIPSVRSSSYSFSWVILKRCRLLCHVLWLCMWLKAYGRIIFIYYFCFANLVIFQLQRTLWLGTLCAQLLLQLCMNHSEIFHYFFQLYELSHVTTLRNLLTVHILCAQLLRQVFINRFETFQPSSSVY